MRENETKKNLPDAEADGIMIEVHNNPLCALCDGAQSLTPDQFETLAKKIFAVREVALG